MPLIFGSICTLFCIYLFRIQLDTAVVTPWLEVLKWVVNFVTPSPSLFKDIFLAVGMVLRAWSR